PPPLFSPAAAPILLTARASLLVVGTGFADLLAAASPRAHGLALVHPRSVSPVPSLFAPFSLPSQSHLSLRSKLGDDSASRRGKTMMLRLPRPKRARQSNSYRHHLKDSVGICGGVVESRRRWWRCRRRRRSKRATLGGHPCAS
ncbi:unnamed protein product, partial [Urochloa humidicola]